MQHVAFMENIGKLTLGPEDAVLDVGCGTGEETKFLASKVKSVTGLTFLLLSLFVSKCKSKSLTIQTFSLGFTYFF